MAKAGRTVLKTYFETEDEPTEAQFAEFIDSDVNIVDDVENGTDKAVPINADKFLLWDSVASALKTLTWANLKAAFGGDTIKAYKASDESRANDTVLTIDSDLYLDLEANSYYIIRLYMMNNGPPAGDLNFTVDYNDTYDIGLWTYDLDNINETALAFGDQLTISIALSPPKLQNLVVWIKTTNAGRFGLYWRQTVSDATASTMMRTSSMVARKYN